MNVATATIRAAAIEVEDVHKHYGTQAAVRGISFAVPTGTLVTLLGPSGCGKTTTLRMLAGLESATSGRIRIGGRDVTGLSAAERDVSMVFQSYALFPHMSVMDNVCYGLLAAGGPKAVAEAKAREGLELVGLKGLERRMPGELSGGQQQRVAVARALVLEPQVLLFDEPLSNLDAKLRRHMREDIRDLQQKLGLTAVYVTHDQGEALAVSDRIIVMNEGRIAQDGRPVDLYEAPADRFIADFIGEANLVPGTLSKGADGVGIVEIAGITVSVPHRGLKDGPVDVAVRPHALRLVSPAEPGFPATLRRVAYLGDHMEYVVAAPVGELFMTGPVPPEPPRPGETVRVGLAPPGVTLVGAGA